MVTITGVQTIMSGSKKKKQPKSRVSKVYLADDGTVIDAKDWKWLQEKRIGTPQSVWLRYIVSGNVDRTNPNSRSARVWPGKAVGKK